ncbi:DUF6879 family protein [Streptomyces cyaneofuscatus]|uniref:DUF6879 family protein n=2 Tax=Streptomyces cyaneofuscatus TaxID=66883 RepID=UPI0013DB5488|nr:DUF6879 family protein [Streptomyces cyaneofuscatus]NDZ64016.1 hypothetical protein [Streptomyces cyaneofuscatus]
MACQFRFNPSDRGGTESSSAHEDRESGEAIVRGTRGAGMGDVARLQYLPEGIIDLEEFEDLFRAFGHVAWRLETRRRFASDEATDTYRQFVETGTVDWEAEDPYCELIRSQTAQGKRVERVRIVDQPPTMGQLYLLNNAKRNSGLGEDIRNLWRADADRLRLPAEDFWLFDSRLAAKLRFDDEDKLVDVELITESAEIVRYSVIRDAAWHHAMPYEEFAARLSDSEWE